MNKIMDKKSLLIADQIIFSGTAFLLTILMSRLMGIELFGVFASMIIVLYLLLSVSQALIIQPMQIYLDKVTEVERYKVFLFHITILVASVFILIGVGLYFILPTTLAQYSTAIIPFVIYAGLFIIQDFFRKYFLAHDELENVLAMDITSSSIQIFAFVYLYLNNTADLSIIFLVLVSSLVPSLVLGFRVYNLFFFNTKSAFRNVFLAYHLKEGKWFLLTAVTQWSSNNLFVLASGLLLGTGAIGALRLGQSIFGVLNILLQTVENYVIPAVNRIFLKSSDEAINFMQDVSKKAMPVFFVALSLIFIFSKSLFTLIGGESFAPYHFVLQGLSLLYLLIVIGYPIRISIRVLELNKMFFLGYVFSFLFSLLAFHFLLSQFGLHGALIGLIINQMIMLGLWQFILIKKQFHLWKSYISF